MSGIYKTVKKECACQQFLLLLSFSHLHYPDSPLILTVLVLKYLSACKRIQEDSGTHQRETQRGSSRYNRGLLCDLSRIIWRNKISDAQDSWDIHEFPYPSGDGRRDDLCFSSSPRNGLTSSDCREMTLWIEGFIQHPRSSSLYGFSFVRLRWSSHPIKHSSMLLPSSTQNGTSMLYWKAWYKYTLAWN